MRHLAALALALAMLCGAPAAAGGATISGKAGGGKVPAKGRGIATVRAVAGRSLLVVASERIRSGRYRLTVPAGRYRLFATTTPFRGKAGIDVSAGKVSVRAGRRVTKRVALRKPKRKAGKQPKIPKIPGFPTARAAFVEVKTPAVWVQRFTVAGPGELGVLRKGIMQMLITDLVDPLKARCGGGMVERERFNDILAELLLSESGRVDPDFRLATDRIIAHNREVSGSYVVAGGSSTLTVDVKNVKTGATRSVSRSAPPDRFFELEQSIVQEVVRLICGDEPPAAYSGPVSGSVSGSDGSANQTLSWSGNVRLKLFGDVHGASGADPPGEYAEYRPESGAVHVTLDGADGECAYHGEADVAIVPEPGEGNRVQQGVEGPAYSLLASLPDDAPPMKVPTTGPDYCGGGRTTDYPLAGRVVLNTHMTQRSSSSTLIGNVTVPFGPAVAIKWAWSLAPQAN